MNALELAKFAPLIALLVAGLRYKQLPPTHRWLAGLVVFAGLIEIASHYAGIYLGTNLPLSHLFVWVEFSLLLTIFHLAYEGLLSRKAWLSLLGAFSVAVVINLLFFQGLREYASHTRALESVTILFLAIRYFFLVLKELKVKNLEKTFAFWFSTALLLYFSGNLLLFIYGNYIINKDDEIFYSLWTLHSVLNFLLYSLYAIALSCKK
jgi:hypothetical protein